MDGTPGIRLKVKRLAFYFLRAARRFLGFNKTVYAEELLATYRRYWEEGAGFLGAEFVPLSEDIWEVRLGDGHTRVKNSMVQLGDPVTNRIAADKPLVYQIAQELDVPVPRHFVFRLTELERAQQFLKQNPGVYVVKATSETTASVGVTTHISTPRQLENAAVSASLFSDRILLEQMIFGETCRLLWLGGEMIHATRQRGVRVTGDGRSTIAQLLRKRGFAHVPMDQTTLMTLGAQALTPDSVPEAGRELLARSLTPEKGSRREPLTTPDEAITHLIGPALIEEVRGVLEATESEIAGVDIITADPRVSLKQSGGVLLEINPGPGIHKHYITAEDYGENSVAVKILAYLLQPSRQKWFLQSSSREEIARFARR
jgi:cyanophycin synthetase